MQTSWNINTIHQSTNKNPNHCSFSKISYLSLFFGDKLYTYISSYTLFLSRIKKKKMLLESLLYHQFNFLCYLSLVDKTLFQTCLLN
jgi:hypothetical protein